MGRKTAKHSNRQNKTKRKQLKYKKSRRGGGSRLNPNHGKSIEQQQQMKNKGPTYNFLVKPPPIIKKGTMKSKKKSGSQSLKPLNDEQLLKIKNQVAANQDRARSHLTKKSKRNEDNIPLIKMLGVQSYERRKNAFNEEKDASCSIL